MPSRRLFVSSIDSVRCSVGFGRLKIIQAFLLTDTVCKTRLNLIKQRFEFIEKRVDYLDSLLKEEEEAGNGNGADNNNNNNGDANE